MPTATFDAVANLGTAHSSSGVSASFTLGGSATALLVAVTGFLTDGFTDYAYTKLTTRTVKVGTKSLTPLGAVNCSGNVGYVELWGMIAPPTGSQTISVVEIAPSGSGGNAYINVTAISFTGVGQFGNAVTNAGTAATATSGAIVSATGNRVLTITGAQNSTLSSPSGTSRSNQPSSPNANFLTLLVQDAAGAATVTNTCHVSNSAAWGDVSINLIAGNLFSIAASRTLTWGSASSASFVGNAFHIGAHASWTVGRAATGQDQKLGPPLRYVGPIDTNSSVTTASYAQGDDTTYLVTPAWVTQQVTIAAANLVTPAYVTQATSAYLTQAAVATQLSSYVPNASLGAANGLAQLDNTGLIPSAQLTTPLTTNNVAAVYDAATNGNIFLPSGQTYTVTSQNINEFILANIEVPNPGYPWIPLPFAYVAGYSGNTASGSRLSGNGNFGMLTCTIAGATTPLYGLGLATDDTIVNFYTLTPNALATNPAVTPLTQPALQGAQTLDLGICNWSGSQYTFSGSGLFFYVLVVPAIGSVA